MRLSRPLVVSAVHCWAFIVGLTEVISGCAAS
jgi:hypothetical protein